MTTDFAMEENSVYPGKYRPGKFERREIKQGAGRPGFPVNQPSVAFIENEDHYKIELVAPGHNKDDFFITAGKDKITVFAVKRKTTRDVQSEYPQREFVCQCFECDAPLPANTDSDFVSAEYKDGILSLYLFKTDYPTLHSFHPIVVY